MAHPPMTTPPAQRHVRDHARSLVIHPVRRRPPAAPDPGHRAPGGQRRPPPISRHPVPDRPPPLATHRSTPGPRRPRRDPRPHPGADHPRGERAAGDWVMVSTDFPDVCGSPFAATIEDAAAAGQRDRTQPNRRVPGVARRQLRNQAGRRPITVRPAGPNPAVITFGCAILLTPR